MKMKQTYAIALTTCMLILGVSCTNDDFNVNDRSAGKTITLKVAQAEINTRVGHSDTEPEATDGIIDVKWKSGDAFALYGSSTPETFTTTDDGKTAYFTGDLPSGGGSFNAFFPAGKAATAGNWVHNVFDVSGQKQTGNNNLDHLATYNYMTASLDEKPNENTLIQFTNEMAVLKFIVTLPGSGITPTRLTLAAQGGSPGFYIKKGVTDASLDERSGQVTLELNNIVPDANNKFTAYMMAIPIDDLSKQLEFSVVCDDGKAYIYRVKYSSPLVYAKGKVYASELDFATGGDNYKVASVFDNDIAAKTTTDLATVQFDGTGDAESPYLISSALHLKKLVDDVDQSETYAGKYFKLTTDIHITADEWTPIGNYDVPKKFSGNFDGDNHVISGKLNGSSTTLTNFGLFGNIYGTNEDRITFENLHITADAYSVANTTCSLGGYNYFVDFSNCTATGNVDGEGNAGGINGLNGEASFSNCHFSGNVQGVHSTGGLSSDFFGNVTDCTVSGTIRSTQYNCGGLVGQYSGTMSNCNNYADIFVDNTTYYFRVGGIIGLLISDNISITECANYGTITVNSSNTGAFNTPVGGLVGSFFSGATNRYSLTISNSTNHGNVIVNRPDMDSYTFGGGLIGYMKETYTLNSTGNSNTGNVTVNGNSKGINWWIGNNRNYDPE